MVYIATVFFYVSMVDRKYYPLWTPDAYSSLGAHHVWIHILFESLEFKSLEFESILTYFYPQTYGAVFIYCGYFMISIVGVREMGACPLHFCKRSGSIAWHILQQWDKMNIIKMDPNVGRHITSYGKRDLDMVVGWVVFVSPLNPKIPEKCMEGKNNPPPPPLVFKEDFKTILLTEKFHCKPCNILYILMDENRWKGSTQSNAQINWEVGGYFSLFDSLVEKFIEHQKSFGNKLPQSIGETVFLTWKG
jgi:hypothetical protein